MLNENETPSFDLIIKLVVLGDVSVGKTNLLNRYLYDEFDESISPTLGMDFMSDNRVIEGKNVQI